jgi:branched-chain amino acid transport system permease protein
MSRSGAALRDALITAAIALGIFGPLVGLPTADAGTGLVLGYRPLAVGVLVGVTFLARLGWLLSRSPHTTAKPATGGNATIALLGKYLTPLLLLAAVALPFIAGRGTIGLGILVMTYVMLGWGLNIVVGLAGLLDLGYVAFYAVGAYTFALLSQGVTMTIPLDSLWDQLPHIVWDTPHLGFWTCLPIAGLLAALFGVILGFPVLRLRGDYLAIVTLAFGEIIRELLINVASVTGGPNGISTPTRPTLFGLTFDNSDDPGTFAGFFNLGSDNALTYRAQYLYFVIFGLALLTNWVAMRLRRQPLGRAWEALREDEIACRSLGINVRNTKLTAFGIGAFFGGFAGCFFAARQGFISPESFNYMESATILAIVVLGGLGSQLGTVLAAIVMIGGLEELRLFLDWLSHQFDNPTLAMIAGAMPLYYKLIFGLALVVMMIVRPRGLIQGRAPSVVLGGKGKTIDASLVAEGSG